MEHLQRPPYQRHDTALLVAAKSAPGAIHSQCRQLHPSTEQRLKLI